MPEQIIGLEYYPTISRNALVIEEFASHFKLDENPLEPLLDYQVRITIDVLRSLLIGSQSEEYLMEEHCLSQRHLRSLLSSLKNGKGAFEYLEEAALTDPDTKLELKFNPPNHNRFLQSNSTAERRESSLTST